MIAWLRHRFWLWVLRCRERGLGCKLCEGCYQAPFVWYDDEGVALCGPCGEASTYD